MNPHTHENGFLVLAIVAIAALVVGLAFAGPGTCW